MSLEQLDLPDGPNGESQWVKRQVRPSGGEMEQIERETVKVRREGLDYPVGYILIAALVKEWSVLDRDGNEVKTLERKGFASIGADTIAFITDDLTSIIDRIRPNRAAQQIVSTIRALSFGVKPEDADRLNRLADEFAELMGLGDPNARSQAA